MRKRYHEGLPQDCWELILDRVDCYKDRKELSMVCKEFLSITNRFQRSLQLFNDSAKPEVISKLLQRYRNLKVIVINSCVLDFDSVVCQIARSGLDLEELDLQILKNLSLDIWKELGSNMKSLKVLKGFLSSLGDSDLIAIADSLPWLEELNICFNRQVTDEGIEHLSQKLCNLRKINLFYIPRTTEKSLVALSKNCQNLISLKLWSLKITAFTILESISSARSLRVLEFTDLKIPDHVLSLIAEAQFPLKKFSIFHCRGFSLSGLSCLLCAYPSLEELELENADFLTDRCIRNISQHLRSLSSINLARCVQLTNSTFFTLLKICPVLTKINMRHTSLGIKTFDVDLMKNNHVKFLDVSHNESLNDESLKDFVVSCPNLVVIELFHCYGITAEAITREILKRRPWISIHMCPPIKYLR